MEGNVPEKLKKFQDYIHYQFNDPKLLYQALVTPQYGNERGIPHYEILETLGDAVIKLIFSLKIYMLGGNNPGQLTQIKQRLEDNKTFKKIGEKMSLSDFIFHSKSQTINNTAVIADVFEAICGAVYLDSGKNLGLVKQKIIDRFFKNWNDLLEESTNLQKNELLEFLQGKFRTTPRIEFDYDKFGPDNQVRWIAKNPKIFDNNDNLLIDLPLNFKSDIKEKKKEAEKELSEKILDYLKRLNI